MLKLSISYTRFEVIIVVVQVGAVKIYAVVEALREKEIGGENRMKLSLPPKNGAFLSFTPPPPPPFEG
jgi:hypothetical protein